MSEKIKQCEVCDTANATNISAFDESFKVHWFCSECAESGAAIAYLEELAG
jgi:ribosomal protein L37AE/L43A